MELAVRKVANGYVVEPVNGPGVARDQSKDVFVFETLEKLFAHLTEQFGEAK